MRPEQSKPIRFSGEPSPSGMPVEGPAAVPAAPHVLHADLRERPVDHALHRPAAGGRTQRRRADAGCGGRAVEPRETLGRLPPGGLLARRPLRRQLPLPGPEPVALRVQGGVAGLGRVQLRLHRRPLRAEVGQRPDVVLSGGVGSGQRVVRRLLGRRRGALPGIGVGPRGLRGRLGVGAGDPGPLQPVARGELRAGDDVAVLGPGHEVGRVLGPGEQPERARVEALLVGRGDEGVHPGPCVVDGRARGVGGHPGLLRAPGRLGCRGLRGDQVVQGGRRVLPPGGQVGLQVVGPGVEVGQARRQLPDLGGAGAHLRPAAVQRTVTGVGRRWRGQSGARPGEQDAHHERGEQRGPSHQSPSGAGRPPGRAPGDRRRLPSGGHPPGTARAAGAELHPREGRPCPGRATTRDVVPGTKHSTALAVQAYC